jgi:hypothetical protein
LIDCTHCAKKYNPRTTQHDWQPSVTAILQAAQLLADSWGTRALSHDDSSGSMRVVQLPKVWGSSGERWRFVDTRFYSTAVTPLNMPLR